MSQFSDEIDVEFREWTAMMLDKKDAEITRLRTDLAAERERVKAAYEELEATRRIRDKYERECFLLRADLAAVTAERDALAARLAPVDEDALVEIAAREIAFAQGDVESPNSEFMDENWHCWEPEARAAIAAIRPHIEAAERERCAKIAETPDLWVTDKPSRGCDDIAAAIRSGK